MTGKDSMQLSNSTSELPMMKYLEEIYEVFHGEIPYMKYARIDLSELREKYSLNNAYAQPDFSKLLQLSSKKTAALEPPAAASVGQMLPPRRLLNEEEKLKRHQRYEQEPPTSHQLQQIVTNTVAVTSGEFYC